MPDPKTADQSAEDFSQSLDRLKKESEDVKARIEEERRKQNMPLNSNLGNPAWEKDASDGHLDVAEDSED